MSPKRASEDQMGKIGKVLVETPVHYFHMTSWKRTVNS